MMRMMRKLKTMTVSKIGNNNDDADDFGDEMMRVKKISKWLNCGDTWTLTCLIRSSHFQILTKVSKMMTADFSYFDVMLGLGPCLYRIIISSLFQCSFFVGILNFELMKFETIQERYLR